MQSSFFQRGKSSLNMALLNIRRDLQTRLHVYKEHLLCISEHSNITNSEAITRGKLVYNEIMIISNLLTFFIFFLYFIFENWGNNAEYWHWSVKVKVNH